MMNYELILNRFVFQNVRDLINCIKLLNSTQTRKVGEVSVLRRSEAFKTIKGIDGSTVCHPEWIWGLHIRQKFLKGYWSQYRRLDEGSFFTCYDVFGVVYNLAAKKFKTTRSKIFAKLFVKVRTIELTGFLIPVQPFILHPQLYRGDGGRRRSPNMRLSFAFLPPSSLSPLPYIHHPLPLPHPSLLL